MDKTTRLFAESVAANDQPWLSASGRQTYADGYMEAIERTNVKQLQEENAEMRETINELSKQVANLIKKQIQK